MGTKSYKVALKVNNKKTQQALKQMSGTFRFIYNFGFDLQKYREQVCCCMKSYKYHWIPKALLHKAAKAGIGRKKFIKDLDLGIFDAAISLSSKTFKSAFKLSLPKYYSRKKTGLKFKTEGKVKIYYDSIHIPKFGKIPLCEPGRIPQGKKYSNITFSNDGERWYISVDVDEQAEVIELTGAPITADITESGDLVLNGDYIENVTNSDRYLKIEKKMKRLHKKLVRQAKNNNHYNAHEKKITEVTKNSIKTKAKITLVKNKLKNMRKDFFKKIACDVARNKPTQLHILSEGAVKEVRQNYLTRALRRADSRHLRNILTRKMSVLGSEVVKHRSTLALYSTLGSKDRSLWSPKGGAIQLQNNRTVKQEPYYGEQKKTKNRSVETLITNH